MTSEREKAVALISNARDVLKKALDDLEAALEDHEGATSVAERLIATYGLEPFIRSDGQLGIHFMELSHSTSGEEWDSEDSQTLITQVRDEIDGCRDADGTIVYDEETRTHFWQWRATLAEALAEIDSALADDSAAPAEAPPMDTEVQK